MRIIAGSKKGMTLMDKPKGSKMRPTQDRIKENVFNVIQPMKKNSRVLDLFAGTGQMGLEFLSRGAAFCTFVELDGRNYRVLRYNIDKTGFGDQCQALRMDYREFLKGRQGAKPQRKGKRQKDSDDPGTQSHPLPYDYVYLDPPYHFGWEEGILALLLQENLLAADGRIIMESAADDPVKEEIPALRMTFKRNYGRKCLRIFSRQGREKNEG